MNRDFLLGLGIESDKVDSIMVEHGKTVNAVKEELSTANETIKALNEKQKELNESLKEFEGIDIKALEKAVEDTEAKYKAKINNLVLDQEIEKALGKAKHPELLKPMIDRDKISIEEGKTIGLNDQVENLQEKYHDLFGEGSNDQEDNQGEDKKVKGFVPSNKTKETPVTKEEILAMKNPSERREAIRNNMDLFEE